MDLIFIVFFVVPRALGNFDLIPISLFKYNKFYSDENLEKHNPIV